MEFTRDDAIEAAEQFISGLARFTAEYFGCGAEQLLGIEDRNYEAASLSDLNGRYSDPVDLSAYDFPRRIGELYDFVTYGVATSLVHIEEIGSDVMQFDCIYNYQGAYLADKMGADVMDVQLNGRGIIKILSDVQHAAYARAYISGGWGPGPNPIPLDWLAALAGVSTKTVRNAVTNPGPNQLKASKVDGRLIVWPEAAIAWLRSRLTFKETRFGQVAPQQIESYDNVRQLALHIGALLKTSGHELEQISTESGWSDDVVAAFRSVLNCSSDSYSKLQISPAQLTPRVLCDFGGLMNLPDSIHFAIQASKILASHHAAQQAVDELS